MVEMNSSSLELEAKHYTGRVIMGCDTPGPDYLTIQEIEGKRHRPVWDAATEVEYIGRCRDKAQSMARDIIAQAMAQAAREAEAIREEGRKDVEAAVEAAREAAQANLDAEFQAQAQAMADLVQAISGLGLEVWQSRRRDFAALAKTFTEKALRVEMDSRRPAILESLMDEALTRLDAHREFVLKVAPQDFELAKALMEELRASRPHLGQWRIKADGSLTEGGVVLETSDMLADNALGSRLAQLKPFLDQLELPEDMGQAGETDRSGA
ncbi:MAG: flagellar assembly protein FliH [Desulfovibrio sp.]|nr:flagellar assembly protein FliH [Desulfovibrio sp.]